MGISESVSLIIGLLGFLGGVTMWYRGSVEKRYAAERAFEHIKEHYKTLGQLMLTIDSDIEALEKQIIEIKTTQNGMFNRLEGIAARLDSNTWARRSE